MSLIRRRTPQFPNSSYVQSPSDPDVNSSLPPIKSLFDDQSGIVAAADDEEMLIKALEIRRRVTTEIFMEAMRKGKFGITYSRNLVSKLSDFIDFVMIQAASMKQMPEFSHSSFNSRARAFIDDSNVVPMVRWLKHNSLSFPQIGNLVCKSRRDVTYIRHFAEWLKSINVKGRFIGVAMLRSGENVFSRSFDDLDENIEYLEKNGVRRDWIGFVISRCPEILSFSMEELKMRVEFYLNLGMNENDFGTMVFYYPKVLGYLNCVSEGIWPSNEDVGRVIALKPHLMGCIIEEKWKPLVKFFYYIGISKEGMQRILIARPIVFCIDLQNTIVPKVQFLREIGVQEDAIGDVLARFPRIFTYSLEKKIRPTVIFLLTKAGVSQRNVGKVIAFQPELLGCSIAHKLDPNVKFFLSLSIPLRKLGEMIADYPLILRYDIEKHLRPKYKYLRRTMVRPLEDLIEFPRFFSYSLEDRMIPRHKVLVENRVNFKLRYMLKSTDEKFEEMVQDKVERRGSEWDQPPLEMRPQGSITIKVPIVFCIDLQNTIVPKVQFLREIGVQENAIGDVLARFPRIFTYSLEKKIRPTVIFLLTKAGVSQRNVGKVIAFQPELLGCSIAHKLDPNVKFFLSLGIPLRKLGEMIADYPLILRYDIEKHLRPKYKYLRRTMVRPL
nr:transcription termination factor MTERF2, chloroplastic [Ipomoea batatas]